MAFQPSDVSLPLEIFHSPLLQRQWQVLCLPLDAECKVFKGEEEGKPDRGERKEGEKGEKVEEGLDKEGKTWNEVETGK